MIQYLSLYLDHPKVGCGWRSYLILKEGRKWTRLLCTETAEAMTLSRKDADKLIKEGKPLVLKPTRLAKRIRAVAKTYNIDTQDIKAALTLLKTKNEK
jgi:hypothetical protein